MQDQAGLRRALTAHDRALVKRLVDAELRRRHEAELEQIRATKRRYEATVEARRQARAAA